MSNYPNQMFRPSRYVRLLSSLVLVIGLVIFAVFSQTSLFDETKKTAVVNPKKISQQFFRSLSLDGSLPICDKGLLEIINYPQQSCQVKWYGKRDTAECLDAISGGRMMDGNTASPRKFLHFVFLGDSRIRQHFYNFLKLIPDYDLEFGTLLEDYRLHQNLNVTSRILNMCVSFYWEPLLENTTNHILSQWDSDQADSLTNRVILLGVSIHHIRLEDEDNGYEPYRQKLTELEPILRRITKRSTVIWLNQYSVIDDPFTAFVIHEHISNIVSIRVSIHQYNLLAENILRHSGVIVWNTGSLLTDEYIRGCYIQIRDDLEYQSAKAYFSCSDLLHPGFVVMSQAIQLILNEICNGLMVSRD
ncbi:N-acetylneuraminate 9-O-acetyltransferase-like [Daphnia pulicaria]|uniref:N-acetylneuraminate 9-O-acetyltransferase-like n=1 Tax=Daphnia pulicaria TaxID=35523 RepID=UPI001EEAB1A7|nr:N-acetylneuraminate 9-O-acetyltransferase-like [Daphnia pulicaria]